MDVGITVFLTDRTLDPAALARAVEERGYASLYFPEHTHLPVRADVPPTLVAGVSEEDYRRSYDPLVALAAAASVTERIRLGTGVLLVAQHDPLVLAKQVATLDRLSNGRVVLGVGYGWNRAEAADHGVPFAERRAVAREKLLAMTALWSQAPAEYHGRWVDFDPCWAHPQPVQQPRVRTLIGGGAGPTLFSAVAELADGWMPVGGAGIGAALSTLHQAVADAGRDPATVHVVPFGTIPDPGKLDHFASLGVREVVLRVPATSGDEVLGVLDRYTAFL